MCVYYSKMIKKANFKHIYSGEVTEQLIINLTNDICKNDNPGTEISKYK